MADKKSQQKEEKKKDIARCLDLVVECGVDYNLKEYYMATKLFCSEYNRQVFCQFKKNEDRLMWLKRCCNDTR